MNTEEIRMRMRRSLLAALLAGLFALGAVACEADDTAPGEDPLLDDGTEDTFDDDFDDDLGDDDL
jgi:hypothetical protein